MTNYERIKAMSLEEMAAFVEAAGRNTCHKICVYRQGGENCKKMPFVEERKHGHWLTKKAWHVECSECHHVLEFICDVKKYCPNCGAKMDGE